VAKYANDLADTLRHSDGVFPTPYFNGAIEGRQCQRISSRLSMVCLLLATYIPETASADCNEACATWQLILPKLTRADAVSPDEMVRFWRDAAFLVDRLTAAFQWTSVTAKLPTLCCHAAESSETLGSLRRYSEQMLEASHGRYNENARLYTADTFQESCLGYVQQAAILRAPGNEAYNRGRRRSPVKARTGFNDATQVDNKRTRRSKQMASGPSVASRACLDKQTADCAMWARDNLTVTVRVIDAYLKRVKLPPAGTIDNDGEEDVLVGGPNWDELLEAETASLMCLLQE